eukprot:1161635-Pelagomonas_calceolata.AAC.14
MPTFVEGSLCVQYPKNHATSPSTHARLGRQQCQLQATLVSVPTFVAGSLCVQYLKNHATSPSTHARLGHQERQLQATLVCVPAYAPGSLCVQQKAILPYKCADICTRLTACATSREKATGSNTQSNLELLLVSDISTRPEPRSWHRTHSKIKQDIRQRTHSTQAEC